MSLIGVFGATEDDEETMDAERCVEEGDKYAGDAASVGDDSGVVSLEGTG